MKKALAFVFLASVLLRVWIALGYWNDKPLTQDAKEYLELATNFNKTGSFQYDPHRTLQIESYGRAPGYPFWLAVLLRIQTSLAWIRLAEVLVNLASTYFFFLLGRELFGFRGGISTFLVATFYLPFVSLIPPVLSENLWLFMMLAAYLYLVRTRTRPQENPKRNMVISIFLFAMATLIRPGAVFLLPFFCWWIKRYISWKAVGVVLIFYFALLLPWNLYLYSREARWIFVASEGPMTFWTGTHPRYSGDGDLASNPEVQKDYRDILQSHQGEPPAHRERFFQLDGIANILSYPARYAWIEMKKLLFAFLPLGASVRTTSLLHQASAIAFYMPILVLALMAFRKASPEARYLLAGITASYILMVLLFFPQERFRIAMLDPVLMLFAASEISRRVKNI